MTRARPIGSPKPPWAGPRPGQRLRAWLGRPNVELELFALVMVPLAFAVMLPHLGAKAFWVDEAIAVLPAESILSTGLPRSPFDLNYMAFQLEDGLWDPSAPLYRYAVAAVAAIAGFSETSTRGLSVLCGLLLLWPCHALFQRLYGRTAATLSVVFLAALPAFAEHCREARHFTFVAVMMAAALHFLARAADGDERARGIWPVFLVATLLGHSIGYVVLPVLLAFLVEVGPTRLFSRRYWPVYAIAICVYLAIQIRYWNTLPFFHSIGCHNRVSGCEQNPVYYFATIASYFGALQALDAAVRGPSVGSVLLAAATAVPLLLMALGFGLTVRSARREPERRSQHVLVLAWFVLPLLLLSMQELKFARYVFYVLPPGLLFVARGAVALAGWRRLGRAGRPALLALSLFLVFGPAPWSPQPGVLPSVTGSRFITHALATLRDDDADGWEGIRAQVAFLRDRMVPGDEVVTSFDDASLGYYLGRFVHGFLNSEHGDGYFMKLLDEAARRKTTVFFFDTLPVQNHCHTAGDRPINIDCRKKYPEFYAACMPGSPTFNPACVRRPVR